MSPDGPDIRCRVEERSTDLDTMANLTPGSDNRDEATWAAQLWSALGISPEQEHGVDDRVEMQRVAGEGSVE